MPRCFLAMPILGDTAESLVAAQPPPTTAMRILGRAELHLTLHFLGELSRQQVEVAGSELTAIQLASPSTESRL